MDESAIKEIKSDHTMEITAQNVAHRDLPVEVVHKDYELKSIEHLLPQPLRFRGALKTSHIDTFASYVNEHHHAAASACFIDADKMAANVIIDLGDSDDPGHRDHIAKLHLTKTPEYAALCDTDNTSKSQKAMAEWLEDWVHCFEFSKDVDGGMPTDINPKRVITAVRNITIEQASKAQHETQSLSERRSAMQSVEANSSTGDLPDTIMFTCAPYEGLDVQTFELRLSITTGDRLGLTLRIKNHEEKKHRIAENFKDVVTEALEEAQDLRIYIGSFEGK